MGTFSSISDPASKKRSDQTEIMESRIAEVCRSWEDEMSWRSWEEEMSWRSWEEEMSWRSWEDEMWIDVVGRCAGFPLLVGLLIVCAKVLQTHRICVTNIIFISGIAGDG